MPRPARRVSVVLLTTLFAFAVLFAPAPLPATDFPHFDGMNDEMRAEFLVLMVETTEQAFRAAGQADFADQTEKLFTSLEPGDSMTLGMVELIGNVDRARVADLDNLNKNPKADRLAVEDALFVTLQKNNMMLTTAEMNGVLTVMGAYHWMTFAEFEKLSSADQYRMITLDANLGFFTMMLYSEVADELAGKKKTTDPDEDKANALMERQVINTEFLSPAEPAFAKVEQQIADAFAKTPNDPGILFTVAKYILTETDAQITAEMKEMENSTYHLGDPPPSQQSAWQQLVDALKKAAAASQSQAGSAQPPSSPPAAAPPAPAATASSPDSAPADDPIGGGGIISPPSTFSAMICVEQSLVDNQAFNSPPAGGKMEAFKNIAATYVHDTAKPDWQYLLRQQDYGRFNPSANPDPSNVVISVSPDDHDVFGGCPSGYAQCQIQISR